MFRAAEMWAAFMKVGGVCVPPAAASQTEMLLRMLLTDSAAASLSTSLHTATKCSRHLQPNGTEISARS